MVEELEDPLVKKGRQAWEGSLVPPIPVGSGPSREPLCFDPWLWRPSAGRAVCMELQHLLGAEQAETTERPVSTSVSCAPSRSSTERRWPCLLPDALCPGSPVVESHCGAADGAVEGSPEGRQNKDLLLGKGQGWLEGLQARPASSCRCPAGRRAWLRPGYEPSSGGCWLLPGVQLGVVVLGASPERGFCSAY